MPIKFDDAAQHISGLSSLSDRIAGLLSILHSRLTGVNGNDAKQSMLEDLDTHRDALVRAVVGSGADMAGGSQGRLGPGETPVLPGDKVMTALESDRHSNPTAPIDASGFRVHPADAANVRAQTDPKRAQGFGGNGMGTSADVRTQAALAAADAPVKSLQEQGLLDRTDPLAGDDFLDGDGRTAADRKTIPIVKNEIVPGTEVQRNGVRYVTKRRADGTTYEAVDSRPQNEPA